MPGPEQAELIIRDRRDTDLEAMVTLALESMTWHADSYPDVRPAPPADALRGGFRELVPTADSYVRVAELDTLVVGFLTAALLPPTTSGIEALDEPSVYISDIIVTGTARRRGIARALLADLDDWARARGCHTIRLTMHAGNEPAHRLYEQLGYRPTWITFRKDGDDE
ncbi:GNAT family N-acetyltransferase [Microlunatus speluncae]|uniref:GNAT family N-acetyltransferase n=1 Tax=Microlunatus speluncae TaxID=2594267 RepID=UPI0012662B9D|nr:GNAT family N-acetyltransferase [Microlunatus speluncae]